MFIIEPKTLKKCGNPTITAKVNKITGNPDDWFSTKHLMDLNLKRINFDFFVNWETLELDRDIWFKRTVDVDISSLSYEEVLEALIKSESNGYFLDILKFCHKYKLRANFVIFNDANWSEVKKVIYMSVDSYNVTDDGFWMSFEKIETSKLRDIIAKKTGKRFKMSKELFYGTSLLECYLSKTDTPYPGDVDTIILDENYNVISVLEFKKHNMDTPIGQQQLYNYYPSKDKLKYDRLCMLTSYLQSKLITIYYTTDQRNESTVELNFTHDSKLGSYSSEILFTPSNINNTEDIINYISSVLAL
ncbi:hypothetical protein D9J47_22415 [Escherichia coli]|nr:hypothetical protein [Escherichia coli]